MKQSKSKGTSLSSRLISTTLLGIAMLSALAAAEMMREWLIGDTRMVASVLTAVMARVTPFEKNIADIVATNIASNPRLALTGFAIAVIALAVNAIVNIRNDGRVERP